MGLSRFLLGVVVSISSTSIGLAGCSGDEVADGGGGAGGSASSAINGGTTSTSTGMDWTTVNDLTVVDLGTIDTSENPEIELDIPDKTLGFTLVVDIENTEHKVGVSEMSRVGGQNVVESFGLPGRTDPMFLGLHSRAAQNPQTDLPDAMPLATGAWRALLKAEDPVTDVRARLLVRRTLDGAFHGGVVDVAVRIAPEAATQAYVDEVLALLFESYLSPQVGLDKGEVAFGELAAEYGAVDTEAELHEMVRATASDPSFPRWNLYAVNEMPIFPEALGFAGAIPGSLLPGTSTNAVVWIPSGSVETDAALLAHELGHLAGLFHVREEAGGNEDLLSDTVFGDTTNFMRPIISLNATTFSPKQVTVIQGSALYRGILTDGGEPRPAQTAATLPEPKWRADAEVAPRAPQTELEALLASHWCPRAPGLLEHIWSEARPHADVLLDIAADGGAPPFVRLRALALIDRFGDGPQRHQADRLIRGLASDGQVPASLRGWASRRNAGVAKRGAR
jgi:hypothetical protein